MRSFIIAAQIEAKAFEIANEISTQNKIDKFDISVEEFEKAIGIEDVRKLQKNLYLKPLKSEHKALIINAYRGITIDSQNALLKILEEPPFSSFIFLLVQSENILLPTVLSRCKVIKLEGNTQSQVSKEEVEKLIDNLKSQDPGEKLKMAQDFGKTREDAISWIEDAIIGIRENMISSSGISPALRALELTRIIKNLEEARVSLKNTNVNPRFILENALLSTP